MIQPPIKLLRQRLQERLCFLFLLVVGAFVFPLSESLAENAPTYEDGQGAVELPASNLPGTPASGGRKATQPRVGRRAAEKYMGQNPDRARTGNEAAGEEKSASTEKLSGDTHYLAVHFGTYIADAAYKWGSSGRVDKPGNYNVGVTYRMGEWKNSMDLALRVDFSEFSLPGGSAAKLSFLPVIMFPDASSRFPLYFGVGAGLGVFFRQLPSSSALALDYQVLAGIRFFNLIDKLGVFVEAGLKNHVHLLSSGQYNGTFVAAGAVFTF